MAIFRMQVDKKNRDSWPILASSRVVNGSTAKCYQHGAAGRWQVGDTYR